MTMTTVPVANSVANSSVVVGPGRPRKPIDWDLVEHYAHLGLPQEQIAAIFRISYDTLNLRAKDAGLDFASLYAEKRSQGNAELLEEARKMARKWGPMLIFMLKNQLGWADQVSITGPGGGPLVLGVVWDSSGVPQAPVIEHQARAARIPSAEREALPPDTPATPALPAATVSAHPDGEDVVDSVAEVPISSNTGA